MTTVAATAPRPSTPAPLAEVIHLYDAPRTVVTSWERPRGFYRHPWRCRVCNLPDSRPRRAVYVERTGPLRDDDGRPVFGFDGSLLDHLYREHVAMEYLCIGCDDVERVELDELYRLMDAARADHA